MKNYLRIFSTLCCAKFKRTHFTVMDDANKALNEKYLYKKAVKEAWEWKEEKQCRGHKRDLPSLQIFAMKSFQNIRKQAAFSLVELLMALLVASLLMAALAPVMTKKYKESVEVYGSSSGVRMDYTKTFTKDTKWIVPNGVNYITVTSIGGGGGGGGASYGYKEITSSESNWTVPDGVTKLRVFMTGAGGGGASGGNPIGTAYGGFSQKTETHKDFTSEGENTYPLPDGAKIPELDSLCAASSVAKWSSVANNNNTQYTPGAYLFKVTACGAGGGGGGAGGTGGSGGYLKDAELEVASGVSNLYISIGGGGGYGDFAWQTCAPAAGGYGAGGGGNGVGAGQVGAGANGGTYGGKGGDSAIGIGTNGNPGTGTALAAGGNRGYANASYYGGNGGRGGVWGGGGGGAGGGGANYSTERDARGGGGGGGPTTISTSNGTNESNIIFQIGGGGGGGGVTSGSIGTEGYIASGAGGGGGGYGAGGGAGGSYGSLGTSAGTGGAGATGSHTLNKILGWGAGASGTSGGGFSYNGANGGNGYGGGGSTIFNSEQYCSGGTANSNGKPGALRLYYGGSNVFKCQYKDKSNSGAGGGAGQIWIGEIDVTPGQKINFNIGLGGDGGNKDTGIGINGKDGGSTSVVVNGNTYSVSGGKGGKYESDDTYIANSGGLGGGIKTNDFDSKAKYINWTNIEYTNGGSAGSQGNTVSNGAGGGKGGNTYKKDGTVLQGGNPGGAQANGSNAISDNYGAGGGGGGGVINYGSNPGTGGKGANGYIYIEWGSANGGGGASGQVITEKNVLVSAGSTVEIKVGKGGSANEILTILNGVNGYFGQKGNDGGESYIVVPPNIEEKHGFAKGGIGGYPAGSNHGTGGNFDDSVVNSTKGQPGNDEFGGNGGNITQALCPLIEAIKGLGGCGGNLTISDSDPVNACANPSSGPVGKNAATIGGGGGGGAVKDNAAYKGGNGANGAVIIEWNN